MLVNIDLNIQHMKKKQYLFQISAIMTAISLTLTLSSFISLSSADVSLFKNVEVSIQTSSNLSDYFTVSAFNMSGYMVASYQSQYPAASFELPNGEYIFTVLASQYYQNYYPQSTIVESSSTDPSSGVDKTDPTMPYRYNEPVVEYGYSVQQISGSKTITISTLNATSLPLTSLTISVVFANGTGAEEASVYASPLGGYYWGYESNFVMWNTTNSDGIATLIVPNVPVTVNAWLWVPVNLPKNEATVTVEVGGEEVNVTVYWQPTYVGLAGSALIIPPQTTASINLHVQQPDYWVTPLTAREMQIGVATAPTAGGEATVSAIPASVYQQQQRNPLLQNYQTPTNTPTNSQTTSPNYWDIFTGNILPISTVAFAALALSAVSILISAKIKRQKQALDRP